VPGVFFLAVHQHLDDAIFRRGQVVTTVLVSAASAHAGNRDVGLSFWQSVVFQLLYQLVELHTGDIVRYTPQRALRGISDNTRGLRVDKFVVIFQSGLSDSIFVLPFVNVFDCRPHYAVIARNHRVFKAQIDITLFIQGPLEKTMCPVSHLLYRIGGQHPGVALVQGTTMQLNRVAAAAYEHNFGDASGVGQFAVAEIYAATVHSIDLDIPSHPIRAHAHQIAELDIFARDIAVDAFADGAIRGFRCQAV